MEFTYEKKSITLETAKKIMEAVERKAKEIGVPMVIAVVDEGGNLKTLHRMDETPLFPLQVAQDKAYTAIGFGGASHRIYEFLKEDPGALASIAARPRTTIFGGGYPIRIDGQIVGAIGVAGGRVDQDMECAKAGLEALKQKEK